jgi:lauroyl/myristoyl acyltransferase
MAGLLRLVPHRKRFAVATRVSALLKPLLQRTRQYRLQDAAYKVDTGAEIALYFVLYAMMKHRVTFDSQIEVRNYAAVRKALARGQGLLLVAPHTMLLHLLFRRLHEDGLSPVGLSSDPDTVIIGTAIAARILQPSPTFLLRVRTVLRKGGLVCGMPDRAEHYEKRTVQFDVTEGRIIFAPGLLEIAARVEAAVIFSEVHIEGGRAVATLVEPSSCTPADLTREFMEFIRERIESARQRRV